MCHTVYHQSNEWLERLQCVVCDASYLRSNRMHIFRKYYCQSCFSDMQKVLERENLS